MALTLKDRIWTRVDSSGLGDLIVGANQEGYSGWDSIPLGDSVYYCLVDDIYWEVGHGQYLESDGKRVITRNVLASNSGSKINIATSKSATVFCTYPADKSVYLDLNNNIELPNSDAVLKYIAGIQVTAPAVVTEAVIVDGTAGADGDLAGLLNVYRKDEIDEQQEVQDVQIEKNKQDIVELEEEIEALAPSFDRGEWDYKEPSDPANMPAEGNYFILDTNGNSTADFANAHEILFNNKDVQDIAHTWATVEVGQKIEMFDALDSEYLLAKIEDITLESGAVKFEVTVEQSEGGAGGGSPRVRVKIFQIQEVDVSTLMPKSGGTFTGDVTHKANIYTEPKLPERWINISNKYATNPDGSNNGSPEGQDFGINFNLDYGNTSYNKVKWTTRDGDILSVAGGVGANVTYNGATTNSKHITNKGYVDTAVSGANVSAGRSWQGVNRRPDSSTKFCTDATQPKNVKKIWMHRDFIEQYIQGPNRTFRAGGMITIDKDGEVLGMYVVYQLVDQGDKEIYFAVKGISTTNYNFISNQNYGVTLYCAFNSQG